LYGEARGAESKSDFCHKISVALKELRETFVNLKIISHKGGISTEN
jgi:four helix bundle protein